MKALKQLVKTPAGKELLDYLKGKCDELSDMRQLPKDLTTEELGLHVRSAEMARGKLEHLIEELERDDPKPPVPSEYQIP